MAGDDRSVRRSLAPAIVPPIVAFLAGQALLWVTAHQAGIDYFQPETFVRWDSGHYLAIAEHGYTLAPCLGQEANYVSPGEWCGNAAWFPGYPLLVFLLAKLGLSGAAAGVLLSSVFALGTLLVLWVLLLRAEWSARNGLVLLAAAFFPGQVYSHAVFPISMVTFFTLLCIVLLAGGRWLPASLAGLVVAATYSTGVVLAVVVGGWLLAARGAPTLRRLDRAARAVVGASVVALGAGAVFLYQRATLGVWDGFFRVQEKFDHGLTNPIVTFLRALKPLFADTYSGRGEIAAAQTALVAAFVLGAAVVADIRRRETVAADMLALGVVLVFWLAPLVAGGEISLYRSEALLLPGALLLRRAPMSLVVAAVVAFVLIAHLMAPLFYEGFLV